MAKKTVSEKAKEKSQELASKEETSLDRPGGGIRDIVGISPEDLNLPYVYVVRSNSKHAKLSDGSIAEAGTFYHSVRKSAKKEMEVIVVAAKKGTAINKELSTGIEKEVTAWRALMVTAGNMTSPFVMTFKQMNYWYGWKDLLSLLVAEGINDPKNVVLKMTAKEVTTQTGFTNNVPNFEIARETTKEEREMLGSLVDRFGGGLDSTLDEDTDPVAQVPTAQAPTDDVIENEELDEIAKEVK